MKIPAMEMNTSLPYDFGEEDYFSGPFSVPYQWQTLIEAGSVLILCLLTTIANLVVAASLSAASREVVDFYLLSLCASDLLTSMAVIPLSITAKSSLFAGGGHPACALSGYLHVSLCAVRMYTLMWASVDRYLAVRKPLRYDGIQTHARCQCWVLFSWVTATCLCSPPLLGDSRGHFYHEGFLCLLDIASMLPYSITLGCLVLIPSVLTMLYTYIYIFTTSDCPKEEHERISSYHIATFAVTIEFVLLWLPWCFVNMIEHLSGRLLAGSSTRFWLLFFGESYIAWTPITLLTLCRRCRDGLSTLCTKSSSSTPV